MPRVVIVEDEQHIVESLSFVLEREGFEVASEVDGEAGLKLLRAQRPDVLVLDLMLPRMSGFEVLKALRADAALKDLPVVILTAKGRGHDRRMAEELGADAFMTKPFANTDVVAEVRRLATARAR